MKNDSSQKSILVRNLSVAALLGAAAITQSGCDILLASLLVDDMREAKIDEELKAVQKVCEDGHRSAQGYMEQKTEERTVEGNHTAIDGLHKCRRDIEFVVGKKFEMASGEQMALIQDPRKEGFSLEGAEMSLSQVYKTTFELEKKVLSQPLSYCMSKRGRLHTQGVAGNWEPLKLEISDWHPLECSSAEELGKWGFSTTIPAENRARIEELCKGSKINTADFSLKQVNLSIVEKYASFICEKPPTTTPANKVISLGAVPLNPETCPDCKSWVSAKK